MVTLLLKKIDVIKLTSVSCLKVLQWRTAKIKTYSLLWSCKIYTSVALSRSILHLASINFYKSITAKAMSLLPCFEDAWEQVSKSIKESEIKHKKVDLLCDTVITFKSEGLQSLALNSLVTWLPAKYSVVQKLMLAKERF